MKRRRRASHLGRFTLWNNGRRATQLDRFTLWHYGRLATQLGRFNLWHYGRLCTSSETQGQSVGPGEKVRQKFSSTGGKAPGYRLSPDHFQTVKRMLAPDWAQKMLCIIVSNRRTASPEFFS